MTALIGLILGMVLGIIGRALRPDFSSGKPSQFAISNVR